MSKTQNPQSVVWEVGHVVDSKQQGELRLVINTLAETNLCILTKERKVLGKSVTKDC